MNLTQNLHDLCRGAAWKCSLHIYLIYDVFIIYTVLIRIVLNHLIDQCKWRTDNGLRPYRYTSLYAYSSKCDIINGSRTEYHQQDECERVTKWKQHLFGSHIKCLFTSFILRSRELVFWRVCVKQKIHVKHHNRWLH